MVIRIDGLGTDESAWRDWPGLAALQTFVLYPMPERVVVVAPHPDDEVLGVGGLLAMLAAADVAITIVAVSDGEASHPRSPTTTASELAATRRAEQAVALRHLGLGGAAVHRCGLPDGGLSSHEPELADCLTELLDGPADGATWCLVTWEHDGHPDHDAAGRSAGSAVARTGARLLQFPVWTWHWARPGDPRVPWATACRVHLPPAVAGAKRRAVQAFTSQIEPLSDEPGDEVILGRHVLARLTRDHEVVLL